jgi:hypothetical protein
MPQLDLDSMFVIAEAGPLLDKVAEAVPADVSKRLMKLQQDIGLEIDHEMTGAPLSGPGEGPESAALLAAYRPVNLNRLNVLHERVAALPAGEQRNQVAEITAKMPASAPAPAAAPTVKK